MTRDNVPEFMGISTEPKPKVQAAAAAAATDGEILSAAAADGETGKDEAASITSDAAGTGEPASEETEL